MVELTIATPSLGLLVVITVGILGVREVPVVLLRGADAEAGVRAGFGLLGVVF